MSTPSREQRVLLIDPSDGRRDVLARRLRAQGYVVEETSDATTGADMALRAPPSAVVCDLWMPGISGVQLCRLLRSEPATMDVPVILCGDDDEPRNRFWAERAGAAAYLIKGRIGELVRTLAREVERERGLDGFFVQLSGGCVDIRDRLARHLDAALFESIIAAELRALASAASFERLFDSLAQFMSRVTRYRWIALSTASGDRLAIHHHPALGEQAEREAREALEVPAAIRTMRIADEDAASAATGPAPLVCDVRFARNPVARFALGPLDAHAEDAASLVAIVERELGGAVKIAKLVEETERLASTDSLTGLMNRRAFEAAMHRELARASRYEHPLSLVMLDVDHFKRINDSRGHAMGDRVLSGLGALLATLPRQSDLAGRWGGEEFVVACTGTDAAGALVAAERMRRAIEGLTLLDDAGTRIPLTASLGVATWRPGLSLEAFVGLADAAMYAAKAGGRNRVSAATTPESVAPHAAVA